MKPLWIIVDVESDGPAPGLYSMHELGAVALTEKLVHTFHAKLCPLPGAGYQPDALAVCSVSREDTTAYPYPGGAMREFNDWINRVCGDQYRPVFVSDNPAFDFQFVNYYFWKFLGHNPFGWSGRRIGDLYCGMAKDSRAAWKRLRDTKHTHNPVDDAMGNAEALLKMRDMGLKIPVAP